MTNQTLSNSIIYSNWVFAYEIILTECSNKKPNPRERIPGQTINNFLDSTIF